MMHPSRFRGRDSTPVIEGRAGGHRPALISKREGLALVPR